MESIPANGGLQFYAKILKTAGLNSSMDLLQNNHDLLRLCQKINQLTCLWCNFPVSGVNLYFTSRLDAAPAACIEIHLLEAESDISNCWLFPDVCLSIPNSGKYLMSFHAAKSYMKLMTNNNTHSTFTSIAIYMYVVAKLENAVTQYLFYIHFECICQWVHLRLNLKILKLI